MSGDDVPPVIRTARQVEEYRTIDRLNAAFFEEMRTVLTMPYHEWVRRTFGPLGPTHYIDPRKDDAVAGFHAAVLPRMPESEKSVKCAFAEANRVIKSDT